jgi:hypothetical protein
MGELGCMALEEHDPGAAFPGVIGRTTDEPGPAWPAGRRCPRAGAGGPGRGGCAATAAGVREILAWTKAPFLFRNELVADAAAGAARAAKPGEVRRLGKHAAIVVLAAGGGARIEVAASADGC